MSESRILSSSPMLLVLVSLVVASLFDTTAGQIGVCNGMLGDNLPNPSEVVALYKQNNIQRMRIYAPDHETLTALSGSDIELILDVPTSDVPTIASSQTEADTWVNNNIKSYDGVKFRYLGVGNEVTPEDPAGKGRVLIQAMENLDKAVSGLGIKVSTTIFLRGLTDTSPPSHGRFKDEYKDFLQPVIDFLVSKGSPLLLSNYPYFTYMYSMDSISLDYALFQPNAPQVYDGPYTYKNLFDANLDTVYAALRAGPEDKPAKRPLRDTIFFLDLEATNL